MNSSTKIFLLLSLFALNHAFYSQTTLYAEAFGNDDGKGYSYNTLTNPTDNNWTLALVGTPDVNGNGDWCRVNSGYLEWRDNACYTGDYIEFYSATINSTGSNVLVSMDYYVYDAYCSSGSNASLAFWYNLDGVWTLFDTKTSTGGTVSGSVAVSGLSFTTSMQIAVVGNTPNCGQARAYIDNISIADMPANFIPISGTASYTACSGNVYDIGGSGGNYMNNIDGSLTIYPDTPGGSVNINGTITTESGFDYFYVYDGETTSATNLTPSGLSGTAQAVNYTSTHASGALTVRLTSDGSVTAAGVDLAVSCVIPCLAPSALTSSSITATTATISWTAPSTAPSDGYDYYYDPSSSAPSSSATPSGSVAAGVLTDNLSSLTAGTTYYYWVRSNCGSGDLSDWTSSGTFTTLEAVPTITSFTPSSGCASLAEVVVTGTNFGGVTTMTIGGTAVTSFTVDSDTQITATVGTGTDGVIYVQNTAGNASSSGSFTFTTTTASYTTNPNTDLDIVAGNVDVISVVAADVSSYQWQYSVTGSSGWSNIADGTPANVTYSGATTADLSIQPNTSVAGNVAYYKCVVTCGDVSSNNRKVTFVEYCAASGGTLSGLTGVNFSTIDNTTSNSFVPDYSDFYSEYQGLVYRGVSYDLNVYADANGPYTNYQTAWIDWDGSGTFDNDEEYDLGTVTGGPVLSSGCPYSVTVPADAIEGNIRMRVLSRYGTTGSACLTGIDGEIEDYAILVRFKSMWDGTTGTDWHTAANWIGGELPTTLSIVEIPSSAANQAEVTQAVTIASLKIDPGIPVTLSAGSLNVSGDYLSASDVFIGKSTLNVDGDFDGAAGTINMTNADANLELGSTVTGLGGINSDMGTVTYDGATQDVVAGTYNNLSIASAGVKTALGTLTLNGNLITAATNGSRLDMGANPLNVAGDLTVGAQNGLDLTDASALLTLNGTLDQSITHPGNATAAAGATVTENYTTLATFLTTDNSGTYDAFYGASTPTGNTGPSSGYLGVGDFAYFNGAGGITGETNYLSETLDFSTFNSPQISYYYHMYGADMGSLALQVNTGGGWTSLWSVSGSQQGSEGSAWKQNSVDLAAYAGEASCQIRFLATRGSGNFSDIALDDIVVSDLVGAITGNFEFVNLTINKPSGNIQLLDEILVDGTLTLTAGYIDASANNLVLTSAATISGGSDASHVIGTMVKTTTAASAFTFPLGDGIWYKAIGITPNSASSTVWTAEYFDSEYATTTLDGSNGGDLDHISAYEYWDLDRVGSANAVIALPWVSQNAVSVYADLRLAHFDGTDWDMISATPVGTNTSGVVTSGSVVTTYSPFTLGSSSSSNTLPIELVSFSGEKKDNRNILNWTTASEINNAYFTVEKSYNGIDFEWVGTQEGSSPSTQIINYSLSDYNILETLNYYRLKQTDFDGKFEYSKTISIDNRVDNSFKEIIGRTNLLGQEVDEFYNGIVIVRYKDGTSQKFYQFK